MLLNYPGFYMFLPGWVLPAFSSLAEQVRGPPADNSCSTLQRTNAPSCSLELRTTLLRGCQAHRDSHQHQALFSTVHEIESITLWRTVLKKTIHPIIRSITISEASLCWNEERSIHLINYEEQPDSMHSFLIVLGSATACDDILNAFSTE